MCRRLATFGVPVLVAALLALSLWTFAFRQASACDQVNELRDVVRTVLVNAKTAAIASPDLTTVQRSRAVAFYDDQIALLKPHDC